MAISILLIICRTCIVVHCHRTCRRLPALLCTAKQFPAVLNVDPKSRLCMMAEKVISDDDDVTDDQDDDDDDDGGDDDCF